MQPKSQRIVTVISQVIKSGSYTYHNNVPNVSPTIQEWNFCPTIKTTTYWLRLIQRVIYTAELLSCPLSTLRCELDTMVLGTGTPLGRGRQHQLPIS